MADVGMCAYEENPYKLGVDIMGAGMRQRSTGKGFYLPGGGRFRRGNYQPGGGWLIRPDGTFMRHVPGNVGNEFKMDPFKMGHTDPNAFKMGCNDRFKMGAKTRYWTPGGGTFYTPFKYTPGGGWHKWGKGWRHTPLFWSKGEGASLAYGVGARPQGWMALRNKQKTVAARLVHGAKSGNKQCIIALRRLKALCDRGSKIAERALRDCAQAATLMKTKTAGHFQTVGGPHAGNAYVYGRQGGLMSTGAAVMARLSGL